MANRRKTSRPAQPCWLVLFHRIPPKSDYLRVKVGRRLKRLGAVAIKNSVYVLPLAEECPRELESVVREIQERSGEVVVCEARFVQGLSDDAVEDLFREARDAEYAPIGAEARRLAASVRGAPLSEARRRTLTGQLERLRKRFAAVLARDRFGARGREQVAGLLSMAEDLIQGVELPGARPGASMEPLHGATWVTRTGIMVDRIASAWLIRRFIDPAAKVKFVNGRGYKPARGELRFDMSGAEFTHEGARCTFEVLVERFKLRDSALRPIAEIVHDLDLEDSKYGREETVGVGRMIVGLAIGNASDEVRLAQGGAVFENLYKAFRRRKA